MKFTHKIIVKSKYTDIKTCFKKYLQSYLRWLYEQNFEFIDNLTTDEIVNFFINNVNHPLWFQLYLRISPFRVLVETNNYIEKYKKNASKMDVELPIELKETVKYISVIPVKTEKAVIDDMNLQCAKEIIGKFRESHHEKMQDEILEKMIEEIEKKGVIL